MCKFICPSIKYPGNVARSQIAALTVKGEDQFHHKGRSAWLLGGKVQEAEDVAGVPTGVSLL